MQLSLFTLFKGQDRKFWDDSIKNDYRHRFWSQADLDLI